jgi:hypothetical protein
MLAAVSKEHVRFLYKTWEEIETSAESIPPCIPDHRIPLQEALEQGQKNHS